MPLDVKIRTPENIVIRYELAGISTRAMAFFWDCLLQGVILLFSNFLIYYILYSVLRMASIYSRSVVDGIAIGLNFIIFWFYHVFFEVFKDGQTPGKYRMNIRVVMADGHKVEFFPSVIRNILKIIDFFPFLFTAGLLSILITEKHQRLGDLVAGTVVIRDMDYSHVLHDIKGIHA